MKLLKIYKGIIKTMNNTPCKIAIFTDGNRAKVLQKEFFINNYGLVNWSRNIVLEKYNVKVIESKLISAGFVDC